jgi:iron complex transport system ATP-binding protein
MDAIEIINLYFSYNHKGVLYDINFNIKKGEFVGIIGPNGAGKSTILRIMAKILKNYEGRVNILGRDIRGIKQIDFARIVAFVPQETHFLYNYSVYDIISMGRYPYLSPFHRLKKDDIQAVDWAIEQTGLEGFKTRLINSISSGERQMAVIARALAQKPDILLLDEPTSHLDIKHQVRIMELLRALNQNGFTIVVVNHDLNLSSQYCDKLILLNQGKVYKIGTPAEVIKKDIIQNVYGIETLVIQHPGRKIPQVFFK